MNLYLVNILGPTGDLQQPQIYGNDANDAANIALAATVTLNPDINITVVCAESMRVRRQKPYPPDAKVFGSSAHEIIADELLDDAEDPPAPKPLTLKDFDELALAMVPGCPRCGHVGTKTLVCRSDCPFDADPGYRCPSCGHHWH